jgi:hypothetical protein
VFKAEEKVPDGNCFYHSLLHLDSPVRGRLPGTTPFQLRSHVLAWFERNRALGEYVIRRSFGPQVNALLSKLKAKFGWIDLW